MRRSAAKIWLVVALILVALVIAVIALIAWQGRRDPVGRPYFVALGSSYAAGAALGPLQPDSPWLCARSTGGYPQRLARRLRLPIVDMTCGGATLSQVLHGGQFFQGPQVRAIDRRTRLVTITGGGNDVGYIGDLSLLALRNRGGVTGRLVGTVWHGPAAARDDAGVRDTLAALIRDIRRRAPDARIVVATYPAVLPPHGTCAELGLTAAEVDRMRAVGDALAAATRTATRDGGALLVDMHAIGAGHDACSAAPWVKGDAAFADAPFHPTALGAEATARAIAAALSAAGNPPPASPPRAPPRRG